MAAIDYNMSAAASSINPMQRCVNIFTVLQWDTKWCSWKIKNLEKNPFNLTTRRGAQWT